MLTGSRSRRRTRCWRRVAAGEGGPGVAAGGTGAAAARCKRAGAVRALGGVSDPCGGISVSASMAAAATRSQLWPHFPAATCWAAADEPSGLQRSVRSGRCGPSVTPWLPPSLQQASPRAAVASAVLRLAAWTRRGPGVIRGWATRVGLAGHRGEPTWSYCWRRALPRLGRRGRGRHRVDRLGPFAGWTHGAAGGGARTGRRGRTPSTVAAIRARPRAPTAAATDPAVEHFLLRLGLARPAGSCRACTQRLGPASGGDPSPTGAVGRRRGTRWPCGW
jgi:hypothetical protein